MFAGYARGVNELALETNRELKHNLYERLRRRLTLLEEGYESLGAADTDGAATWYYPSMWLH